MSEQTNAPVEKKGAGKLSIIIIATLVAILAYFGHGYFTDVQKSNASVDSICAVHVADSIAKVKADSVAKATVVDTAKVVDAPVVDTVKVAKK